MATCGRVHKRLVQGSIGTVVVAPDLGLDLLIS